mmetsp:Transcript_24361/g.61628  ORF Transcript_24361/g.61628 Transcript_24361/m.61628 type:complete len:486 (-) Transcript_24361:84-1541(-)
MEVDGNTSCRQPPPDAEVTDVIYLVQLAVSIASVAGSLSIILSFLLLPKLRTFAYRLILYVSISDLCSSLGNLIPEQKTMTDLCLLQAWMQSIFFLSSVLWVTMITVVLYRASVKKDTHNERREPYFHLLCWGIPIALAIPPQALDLYGPAGGWCWISTSDPSTHCPIELGVAFQYIQFYGPLWLCIILNIGLKIRTIKAIRQLFRSLKAPLRDVESRGSESSKRVGGGEVSGRSERKKSQPPFLLLSTSPSTSLFDDDSRYVRLDTPPSRGEGKKEMSVNGEGTLSAAVARHPSASSGPSPPLSSYSSSATPRLDFAPARKGRGEKGERGTTTKVEVELQQQRRMHLLKVQKKAVKKLVLFPPILLFCFIPPTAFRLYTLFYPSSPPLQWFSAVAIGCASCQGVLNALAYGMNENVRKEIRARCCCGGDKGGKKSGRSRGRSRRYSTLLQAGVDDKEDGEGEEAAVRVEVDAIDSSDSDGEDEI